MFHFKFHSIKKLSLFTRNDNLCADPVPYLDPQISLVIKPLVRQCFDSFFPQKTNRWNNCCRAPFGLFYHAAWFTQPHHKEGFIAFLDAITKMPEVWVITNWQAIQWVRDPTPISRLNNFAPFQCNYPVNLIYYLFVHILYIYTYTFFHLTCRHIFVQQTSTCYFKVKYDYYDFFILVLNIIFKLEFN